MPLPDARTRRPQSGSRGRRLVACSCALTALLLSAAARVDAQTEQDRQRTDDWVSGGGTVEVSPTTLTIPEGEFRSYRLRLTRPLPIDENNNQVGRWWVMVGVEGATDTGSGDFDVDGDGQSDIRMVPSVGWEFNPSDWQAGQDESRWREVTIHALQDDDNDQDVTVTLTHELWDENKYCPDTLHPDRLPQVTVRVDDNELGPGELPALTIGDAEVNEGGRARFRVTLNAESQQEVTVRYQTANGTARAGSDYDAVNDALTFDAGTTEQFIEVQTTDDAIYEGDETFTVRLSQPNRATLDDGTGDGTITDDDPLPTLSIDNVTVTEGESARFTVTLSGERALPVTVRYETRDDSAVASADYTATNGTLTFRPGTDSLNITVRTREDTVKEDTETFLLELSDPEGAELGTDSSGTGTIEDDDESGTPALTIDDATATEAPAAEAVFTVRLTAPATDEVTVSYMTVDDTAVAGRDYTTTSGMLTFGMGEDTKTIRVPVLDDQIAEQTEYFTVELSNAMGAALHARTARGTINDNDQNRQPGLSIFDADPVTEGGTVMFRVMLSARSGSVVTVGYGTVDGTATAETDYEAATQGTLTFAANTIEQTIAVPTVEDSTAEQTETFTVMLSNAQGATLERVTATGTITDDDGGGGGGGGGSQRTLSIADADPVTEGDPAEFVVALNRSATRVVTVSYRTVDGSAEAGSDYTATSDTLRFERGDREKTVTVPTSNDDEREETEAFTVELSDPSGATIENGTATGTITDDDDGVLPTLSIADAEPVTEGATAQFQVTLSAQSRQVVTVAYTTASGTATEGDDYSAASGTLTFAAGETTTTIAITTLQDTFREEDETFSVTLSSPDGATLADDTATGTITDDDDAQLPALSIADAQPVTEGSTAQFVVTLSDQSQEVVTVAYTTSSGTATEGDDYSAASGTLTFAAGQTTTTIAITTLQDTFREEDETFSVTLTSPDGATLADDTATGTITDDDDTQLPALSIADAQPVAEGGTAQFQVTLSAQSQQVVTVAYTTSSETATEGDDYSAASGTLTFAAGETTTTIAVTTLQDTFREEDETFSVTLSSPDGATLADDTATGTITDDDDTQLPALSIADAQPVTEGATAQFHVTLSAQSQQVVTVAYTTSSGTATEGDDYSAASGTLTFAAGQTTTTIAVTTLQDTFREEDETFSVTLISPDGATLADDTATGTITDDDDTQLPALSIADAQPVTEGATAQFVVTLSDQSQQVVTVDFATADGTAIEDSDYTAATGTLSFQPGDTTRTISVTTIDDTAKEEDETFSVTLSNPAGATLTDDTATGTITDDDDDGVLPTLSIADAQPVTEGATAQFVVTLSDQSQEVVTVDFATADGTAIEDSDYTAATGTLSFQPGDTTRTISVTTIDDTAKEEDETFSVTLSNPAGATLTDDTATGTITDDDDDGVLPTLSIADAQPVTEGATAQFVVTLSDQSQEVVTVDFATADGTAIEDSDYTAATGTLSFQPGDTTRTISVTTIDDILREDDESFSVTLSNPAGATLTDDTATGTITDDDDDGVLPTLSIADAQPVTEGATAQFVVTLSDQSQQTVTVDFATADATAIEGSDYTAASGTLGFQPGETSKTISVITLDDTAREEDETFSVTLSNPAGATLTDDTATGAINDDDDDDDDGVLPTLSIADAQPVTEGATAQFVVTLSDQSQQTVTVDFATADATAIEGSDYTAASGTLGFQPGETSKTISVITLDDTAREEDETFSVTLSNPAGATLADDTATGTITDNDERRRDLPTLSIADADPVTEGGTARFEVRLSPAAGRAVTVAYRTADGTAVAGSDYTSTTGTLRFEPGETKRQIAVAVLDDETAEAEEDFSVKLSAPSGARLADDTGTGSIIDDDTPPELSIDDAPPTDEGGTAEFLVRLSAASGVAVTVSYRTVDGTAEAGSDYTATSGTLRFEPGATAQVVAVPLLDDRTAEADEVFAVELSAPSGATIADGTATGTIIDDDLPPELSIDDAPAVGEGETAEFLVRLSAASAVAVTVSYRTVDGTAEAGSDYTATSGTLRFEPGTTTLTVGVALLTDDLVEGTERFTVELSDPVGATVADGTAVGTITDEMERRVGLVNRAVLPEVGRAIAFSAVRCRFDRTLSGPVARDGSEGAAGYLSLPYALTSDRQASHMQQPLSPERALADSSFLMPMAGEDGETGRLAAWGCGDYRYLGGGGGDDGVAWNGEAFSLNLGADVRLGSNALAGVSVSRSRGSFNYHADGSNGRTGGAHDLRLTGVHPYVGWSASPGLDVWGTVGHAWGELRIADDLVAAPLTSAATLDSGAAGVTGRLLARGTTRLSLKGEGALARLDVAGDGAMVEGLAVNMRRLRLSTEASRELAFSSGGSLTPWGELGVRHDGGDGETGAGLEVGGGLRYRNPEAGWTTEGYGRWLAVHEGALREWGFGALIRYDPGPSGRGPSVSLMPGWGDTASGVQRLWARGAADPTVPRPPGSRLDAQFGYGLAAFRGRGVLTPFGTVSLDRQYGRSYRLGSRLAVGRSTNVSLEAERRERTAAEAVHAVMVRGTMSF